MTHRWPSATTSAPPCAWKMSSLPSATLGSRSCRSRCHPAMRARLKRSAEHTRAADQNFAMDGHAQRNVALAEAAEAMR